MNPAGDIPNFWLMWMLCQKPIRFSKLSPQWVGARGDGVPGTAAGQTVMHSHIHLIPRREGDNPNPVAGCEE